MDQYESRTAPPVDTAFSPPPKPSGWPVVIGIIAIVLGSLGALGGCVGAIVPLFTRLAKEMPQPAGQPKADMGAMAGMSNWAGVLAVSGILSLLVALLLLFAGIGLVRRTRWSARAVVIWAIAKIPTVVVSSVIGYLVNADNVRAVEQQQQQQGGAPLPASVMQGIALGSIVFGVVWGWAFPVFVLIWFSRPRIREEVAAWDAPGAAVPG